MTGKVIDQGGQADRRADVERSSRPASSGQDPLGADLRNDDGVCGKCYGRDLARGTPVNIGEAVGVIAAQSIGEPGTQLTMRTFHIGGTAQVVEQSFLEASSTARSRSATRTSSRTREGVSSPWAATAIVPSSIRMARERARHRVPYGAAAGRRRRRVKRGQRMAEWDPLHPADPGRSRRQGRLRGSGRRPVDARSHRRSRPASPSASSSTGAPASARRAGPAAGDHHQGQGRQGRSSSARGGEARYLLSVDAIISVEPGERCKAGDVLARIPRESAKTRDITGGLPRVAELFEARRPKDAAIIAEIYGTIHFGKDYKNKRRIIDRAETKGASRRVPDPEGQALHLQEGDFIEKGDYILDGNPAPHDILAIKGVEELAALPRQRDPGGLSAAGRDDQRQAHRGDRSSDAAEGRDHRRRATPTVPGGEQIDKLEFDRDQRQAARTRARSPPRPPGAARHHQGVACRPSSFISAASFQETTRVLTEAAVTGKADTLEGLKENVIVGRLIPAGTGAL